MHERIKQLRKELGLTQQEFANRLNIKRGAIANYEIGRNEPIDAVISLICREFNINEEWLRTGKGEMKMPISGEERYSINIAKLQRTDDETIIRWVNAIAETKPEMLKEIEAFMKKILDME